MNLAFPSKKVSPIQAIPKIAITACIPAKNTDPFISLFTSIRVKISIKPATVIIIISITCVISIFCNLPSIINEGRSASIKPKSIMENTPIRNIITDILALCWSFSLICIADFSSFCNKPSFKRRKYSGSFSRGTPIKLTTIAPTITPISVAGTQTVKILPNVIPLLPKSSAESKAAVAAEIGLAVIACCEAITEIERGRSGRTLLSVAISEMIGKRE